MERCDRGKLPIGTEDRKDSEDWRETERRGVERKERQRERGEKSKKEVVKETETHI